MLVVGLILGVFFIFHQPLQAVFEVVHDIERQYHLDLLQSLTVLCVVFAFHYYRKRHEAKADLRAAAAEAAYARLRSEELERLVHLNRTLALASDFTQVHHALAHALPTFTADRGFSVLICYDGCWDVLVRDPGHPRQQGTLEQLAERMLMSAAAASDMTARMTGLLGVPLAVGLHPMGILLVTDSPILNEHECRALAATAAPIAIAIRNVYTLFTTRDQALRDGLTGCFNHAHAVERLDGELRRARRSRTPLSLIMFDLDGFKGINDGYGHLAGDRLLAEVGRRLAEIARSTDVKCRYGGDEFLLLLPDTPLDGARQVAESIRQAIGDLRIQSGDILISATASVGVITVQEGEGDPPTVLARVDGALYRSKREGRNRVSAGETELTVDRTAI